MASSGSFLSTGWYSSSKGDNVYLEFAWSVIDTSVAYNNKTIYWELRGKRSASGFVNAGGFTVVIDGETVHATSTDTRIELRNGTIVASGTKVLTHNPDGTRSFGVSIQGAIYYYAVNVSGSQTFQLDVIPRASAITHAGNVVLGNSCDVRWTPASASFRYRVQFALGNWAYTTGVIHPNTTANYAFTGYAIPLDVAYQIPNSPVGTMQVSLFSYSDAGGTVQIGSTDVKTFSVTVPDSTKPTVYMSLAPVHSLPDAFNGIYVQGLSRVKASLGAGTQYNASVIYYDVTVEGGVYGSANNYTSGYLTNPGTISVVGHAVDSRQYGGYATSYINVLPYTNPKIQNATARRCDASGNLSDSGTYLKITATRNYQPVVSNGVQKNFCGIRYRYKAENASYYSSWVTILDANNLNSNDVVSGALLDGRLLVTTSYIVEVQAFDTIGNVATSEIIVPTEKVYWHRDGARNALALGKYNERDNALDSAWDIYMNGHKVTGLSDPVGDTDAVTLKFLKQYIDSRLA